MLNRKYEYSVLICLYMYMHTNTRKVAVHMLTMKTENLEINTGQAGMGRTS